MPTIAEMKDESIRQAEESISKYHMVPVTLFQQAQDAILPYLEEQEIPIPWQYVGETSYGMHIRINDKSHITEIVKRLNKLDWHIYLRTDQDATSLYFTQQSDMADAPKEGETFRRCKNPAAHVISLQFNYGSDGKCRRVKVGTKEVDVFEIVCEKDGE